MTPLEPNYQMSILLMAATPMMGIYPTLAQAYGRAQSSIVSLLLESDRPHHEMIAPHFQDQKVILHNQFARLTADEFSYEHYDNKRDELVQMIGYFISLLGKEFVLSVLNAILEVSFFLERIFSRHCRCNLCSHIADAGGFPDIIT